MKTMDGYIASPCVSLCNLGDDGCCTGCGRTRRQIAHWRRYTNEQREEIMNELKTQVR